MPEIASILSAISTVGFPIVCCVVMFMYIKYVEDKHREELKEVNEQHKVEMAEITSAIHNNTVVMQKLTDVLTLGGEFDGRINVNAD